MPNTPKEQKVNYGLKNAYFATITEAEDGAFTYGTPDPTARICRADPGAPRRYD